MKKFNLKSLVSSVLMLALASACGSQATHDEVSTNGSSVNGSQTGSIGSNSSGGSGNIYNLPLANSFVAQINGAGGAVPSQAFTVNTSRTMRIKVTAMSAPNLRLAGYTNYVFPYGCVRVRVSVNGVTQQTQILRVDSQGQSQNGLSSDCAFSATSQTMNFDSAMTGNGAPVVTISNADYDNCRYTWPLLYGVYGSGGTCHMSAEFSNHEVAVGVQIQTDNTWMD